MIIAATIAVSLMLLALFACRMAGEWLLLDASPARSDAIIVLSGDRGRLDEAVRLYEEGYGKYLILSNAHEWERELRGGIGIPAAAILEEDQADSTYTNAKLTLQLMRRHGLASAVVVTSDYHARRTKMVFGRVYRGSDIDLTYDFSETPYYHADRWWTDRFSVRTTIREWVKWTAYGLFYW